MQGQVELRMVRIYWKKSSRATSLCLARALRLRGAGLQLRSRMVIRDTVADADHGELMDAVGNYVSSLRRRGK